MTEPVTERWAVGKKPGRYYLRFPLNERIQHLWLMISVFLLIATGMPVYFHTVPTAELVVRWIGGNPVRETLHRIGAILLLSLAFYHIFYIVLTYRGRERFKALLPTSKDFRDFWHMLKYYLGLSQTKPLFGRFSYIEKFEYWAVFWGIAVMGITGLTLWFPTVAMLFLPKWATDVARVIHSYEALLAFLSIILWHFYNVHLNPSVFPMSTAWIDGLISEEHMREEHPLEYAQVKDREEEWVWVLPPTVARPEVAAAPVLAEIRVVSAVASAWGGSLVGAAVLVPILPVLALCLWFINPEESGWVLALRLASFLVLPSSAIGAAISVALCLQGRSAGQSVFTTFTGLLGFYLSTLSLWVTFAAGFYVLHWFFPSMKIATGVMSVLLLVSLLLGLVGGIWAAGRGKIKSQRLFHRPEDTEPKATRQPLSTEMTRPENTPHRQEYEEDRYEKS